MIIDLPRFVEADPEHRLPVAAIERLHYLYERCSADLSKLDTFSTEPRLRAYLETLVSRAYSEIHETRTPLRIRVKSLVLAFPRAFRRHLRAFQLSVAVTLAGLAFGWVAVSNDPQSKAVLLPFPNLMVSPAERVAHEEHATTDVMKGVKASFSAELMTHNIQVTVLTMALGMTWGAGTLIMLFYNGVILGAVSADYILGGQGVFLAGWLLPHGSIEIPSILLGGQAGFILAGALIGWGSQTTRTERLRAVSHDLFAIIAGAGCMLVWAGIVESFISQYHQPVLPYALKIAFGCCELTALVSFLTLAGRE
jgi:uncharacterized membrane protein SpoIIM required for sporulation